MTKRFVKIHNVRASLHRHVNEIDLLLDKMTAHIQSNGANPEKVGLAKFPIVAAREHLLSAIKELS